MTNAEREAERCRRNVERGGDPKFWQRRLARGIADRESELAVLRRALEAVTPKPGNEYIACPNCDRVQRWCIDCVSREVLRNAASAAAQERAQIVAALRRLAVGFHNDGYVPLGELEVFAKKLEAEP